jgi:hypothetical protein
MNDAIETIEAKIAAMEEAYRTAELRLSERHKAGDAHAKLHAGLAMGYNDAYRQGLIEAWEALTGRPWAGVKELSSKTIY